VKAGVLLEANTIDVITPIVIDAINKDEHKGNGFVVPIVVSARRLHLTREPV
jgi:hypothetical protein